MLLPHRLRIGAVAAWLGVIALGLNALVPVHLAFDLAHALAPDRPGAAAAADHDFVRCLLTLLTGHHDEDEDQSSSGPEHHHHHDDCAVCGAIGALAGFAPVTVVLPAVPIGAYLPVPPAVVAAAPRTVCVVAYHSRAPPIA
jgi:hypothetical protein